MQQLEAMATKLLEAARKLPAGPVGRDILEEIGKFADRRAEGEGEMSELDPTPELPDNMPSREDWFPTQTMDALLATGLKTVGQVRTISDDALLALPDFGTTSVTHLRHTLGLPSTDGVGP